MRHSFLSCLAGLALAGNSFARPNFQNVGLMSMDSLLGRRDTFDPDDLSFIKRLAAIGDSYSAGIGAGDMLGGTSDFLCRRYDHSYPNIINGDDRLGGSSGRTFQFESCSGAVVKDVVEKQIPELSSNQDVILLSAGGNDAELTNILNQCVFQWFALNKWQATVGKFADLIGEPWAEGWDWEAGARGCDGQLKYSREIINSAKFSSSLDSMLEAAKKKLTSDGKIYYTGYAKFFGTELTSECDTVTWTTWIFKTYNIFQEAARLTSSNRRAMNELVDLMNEKLEAAVKRAGSKVEFVNYDTYVGMFQGRYCEKGVDESASTSKYRPDLMFYELNLKDPWGTNPWKRSSDEHYNGTFGGFVNTLARATEYIDSDAKLRNEDAIEDSSSSKIAGQAFAELESATLSAVDLEVPNLLPDGYGRVFHPQILLHEIIANLVLFRITNNRLEANGYDREPEIEDPPTTCPVDSSDGTPLILTYKETKAGEAVKKGTKLRILPVGDSITVGFLSERNGGDGNGYRGQLKKDLSADEVVFAGTESSGTMSDGYYAAWSGQTIQYISNHVGESLEQRPNIILLAAGTNDMNPNPNISKEGNDPAGAAKRLGELIDKMIKTCPDATILVAMIVNTCNADQSPATKEFQQLIPGVVKSRKDAGKHVIAVDFTTFKTSDLQDCIHPTNDGYKIMGDYWYSFIHQIPSSWIKTPVGDDPDGRDGNSSNDNSGIDKNIPAPDWGKSPIQVTSKDKVAEVAKWALGGRTGVTTCKENPGWQGTGKIALGGVGSTGDWQYHKDWEAKGEVAEGLGWENKYVRLHDMNGDGKADYVWIHPETGEIRCWLNNLPAPWSPAGSNNSVIGSGVGPAKYIYIADMNGDKMEDYLVVNPRDGSVRIWWNYGPDENWVNGWKFVEGGEIASGVPHANLDTLRFPDINGDGRADYVYIGEGGSLKHHMNTGSPGGQDVLFRAMGGIATGAVRDISKLVFADMNGDGRDDYLIWDDDGGLTGFLNKPTNREGVPVYVNQGPAKTIADGIHEDPSTIRLADMDGDGRDDYVHVGDHGKLTVWSNNGKTADSMTLDGVHFADIDGDGIDDYIWLEPDSGAPKVFLNAGVDSGDSLGWAWKALNGGKPIASGAAPASQVVFGDIDGDGRDDYLAIDPEKGGVTAYLNIGEDKSFEYGWRYKPIGKIASGLGPGKNVRIADIDGDGRDDYIYLKKNGGTTIYKNRYFPGWDPDVNAGIYEALPAADASGIGQSPDEIQFYDINGDGKADYVWTRKLDGRVLVWYNEYPNLPAWREGGEIAAGVGTSGANIRYARLTSTGRADYVAVDPESGAIAPWLNGCGNPDTSEKKNLVYISDWIVKTDPKVWKVNKHLDKDMPKDFCDLTGKTLIGLTTGTENNPEKGDYPTYISDVRPTGDKEHSCQFVGSSERIGRLQCKEVSNIQCYKDPNFGKRVKCDEYNSYTPAIRCEW